MAISDIELGQIYSLGVGKLAWLGDDGSGTANSRQMIAQTMPFELFNSSFSFSTGGMAFSPIVLSQGQTIRNISFIASNSRSGGTHLWYALYDDGRGSSSANQLALLAQTADNTGAALMSANVVFSQALTTPYTTTYSGVYNIAIGSTSSGQPTIYSMSCTGVTIPLSTYGNGAVVGGATAGSGLTSQAPNPSGAITVLGGTIYGYVS